MKIWRPFLVLIEIAADLPLHAGYVDLVGYWHFEIISEELPVFGDVRTCGSTLPNSIENIIQLNKMKPPDYIDLISGAMGESGEQRGRFLELSSDRISKQKGIELESRSDWDYLSVYNRKREIIGHWTLIFDEGFDIVLDDGETFTGFFKFTAKDPQCDIVHAVELRDTSTGCVQTLPTATLIGWFDKDQERRGCFTAEKIDGVNSALQPRDCTQRSLGPLTDIDKVPQIYSVGDPILRPDLMEDWESEIPLQGKCGSCYGIATAYATVKRLAMGSAGMRFRPDLKAMVEDITDCSLYNQGCSGGYPYLAHKWLQNYGGVWRDSKSRLGSRKQAESMSLLALDGQCRNAKISADLSAGLPWSYRLLDKDRPLRIARHGYVGGCFGCANESLIRREIFNHGPVVAAIDVPHSLLSYVDGIVGKDGSPHHRLCDLENVNGWEYTNHAVVLVGFGVSEDQTPFWIARNSWGAEWGREGYFRVVRGMDFGGIENQVTYADPRMLRF